MKILKFIAVLAALGITHTALAADGTINFTGKVVNQTCTFAQGNGGVQTVALPTVPTSAFSGAGTTAGDTAFTLNVSGCTVPPNYKISTYFNHTANITADGNLKNTQTVNPAGNVELALYDTSNNRIDLSKSTAAAQSSPIFDVTSATPSMNYKVKYYATGATTAGDVQSQVFFDFVYQ